MPTGGARRPKGGSGGSRSDARTKVEAYVEKQSPAHQKTISRLRAIVKGASPRLTEKMRWLQVGYLVSKIDVCGIYASSDHVNLSFAQGATLKDPKGLLEGTGKGIRHIKIVSIEDVGEDTIRGYVREAVASALKS
jgi:hypothetical protein